MSMITNLSSEQLRRAADLKEKISALEQELAELLGGSALVAASVPAPGKTRKNKISAAGIARIKAAQKVRWAKYGKSAGAESADAPAKKKKFTMSPAAKAKIAAAQKARWARVHAGEPAAAVVAPKPKKFTMSAAAKAKIGAAQKARWAKAKAAK